MDKLKKGVKVDLNKYKPFIIAVLSECQRTKGFSMGSMGDKELSTLLSMLISEEWRKKRNIPYEEYINDDRLLEAFYVDKFSRE